MAENIGFKKGQIIKQVRPGQKYGIFAKAARKFGEEMSNPDGEAVQGTITILRDQIKRNFDGKKNPDGSEWRRRELRPETKTARKQKEEGHSDYTAYWRTAKRHPLLEEKGTLRRTMLNYKRTFQVKPTQRTVSIEIKLTGKARKYGYLMNYGGTTKNSWSFDGKSYHPTRSFAWFPDETRKKIETHWLRVAKSYFEGNKK